MVFSQVYSQHPSRCLLSVAHQHRSWGSSNAEMRLLEVDIGERSCKGNSASGGNLRPSEEYACSGYASTSSPIKSSWIQRLNPAHMTREEQPQFTNIGREGFDGLQADRGYDAGFKSDVVSQSGFALYENSRRSRHFLSTRHEILLSKNTTCNEKIGVSASGTSRICKPLQALQPQVPPRTLPVVESLLNPGCSKHVMEDQLSTETNNLHNLPKCSGFSNSIKQTVHFSADERSRVSCSSFEGLKSCSARCEVGDFNASLLGDKCFNASQPTLEFPFNHPEAALRSNMDSIYGNIQAQTCTYSGMDLKNGRQAGETSHSENRDPASTMGLPSIERRYRYDEKRFRCLMPYNTRAMDSFPECFMQANLSTTRTVEDLHVDKKSIQTMSNRNRDLSQEHQDYGKGALFSFEVSCGKGGALTGGECSNSDFGKNGSQLVSNMVSSQFEANVREKTSISLAPCVVEQELGSSQDSHKKQDVTSGSFSFHSKGRLPYVSVDAKVAIERGHWPFCETSSYIEHSVQTGLPKDQRARDLVEASRLGMSINNLSSTQPELDKAHISKNQCSPFFGTETLTEYGRHRIASKHDISPHKPTCVDSKGVYTGEPNAEALCNLGVIQDAGIKQEKGRQLNDGIISSRSQSISIIKGVEEREEKYTHPSGAIRRINWEGFKPPFKISTLSVGSIESCSKRPVDLGTQDLATNAEARNTLTVLKGPIALPSVCFGEHSPSFSVGSGLNKVLDGPKSEGRGARNWNDESVLRQKMWLKRWSSTRPREERAILKLKSSQERGVVNSRHFVENDHSSSQSSWQSSHHFDLRPAKRACFGQVFGLRSEPCQAIPVLGSIAFGRENQQGIGVTSHFMKRFLTPSAAAMAVMGMTARKVHATQPQRRGLFHVWPVISSANKSLNGEVKLDREFLTRQTNKKEFLHSSAKPPST